jgi:hypothetical protein
MDSTNSWRRKRPKSCYKYDSEQLWRWQEAQGAASRAATSGAQFADQRLDQIGAEMADAVTFTATLESGESMTVTIGPYNTVAPAVTGTPTVVQTLTTTNGTWAGDATITFARQWQAGNVADPNDPSWTNISGATNLTYVLVSGQLAKYVRCRVTATNSVGSTIAYSNVVGPVA